MVLRYWQEREVREETDDYLRQYPDEADSLPDHQPIDERDDYSDYQSYIRSREWETRAIEAKRRAGWRCQECGKRFEVGERHKLHAHHLTYDRLYRELRQDVKVLCQDCHKRAHGRL